jgi:hypothetical protein
MVSCDICTLGWITCRFSCDSKYRGKIRAETRSIANKGIRAETRSTAKKSLQLTQPGSSRSRLICLPLNLPEIIVACFVTTSKAFFLPRPGCAAFTIEYLLRSDATRCLVMVLPGRQITCCLGGLEVGLGLFALSFLFANIIQFFRRRRNDSDHRLEIFLSAFMLRAAALKLEALSQYRRLTHLVFGRLLLRDILGTSRFEWLQSDLFQTARRVLLECCRILKFGRIDFRWRNGPLPQQFCEMVLGSCAHLAYLWRKTIDENLFDRRGRRGRRTCSCSPSVHIIRHLTTDDSLQLGNVLGHRLPRRCET